MNPPAEREGQAIAQAARVERPPSAVPATTGLLGVAGFTLGVWLSIVVDLPATQRAALVIVMTALPMVVFEWRRCGGGRSGQRRDQAVTVGPLLSVGRGAYVLRMSLGAVASVAPFLAFHLVLRLVDRGHEPALLVALAYGALAVVAVTATSLATSPEKRAGDCTFQLGSWLLREQDAPRTQQTGDHFRTWALKLFFVPFMLVSWNAEFRAFENTAARILEAPSWVGSVFVGHRLVFLLDLTVGLIGYVLTFRVLGSEIRSANPLREAWLFCLICYPPFFGPLRSSILDYSTGGALWHEHFSQSAIVYAWGAGILFLEIVYVWATIAFGIRFSNLTHRGILTNGPYRFVKHPAYLAKNVSWWLWYLPFVPARGFEAALLDCAQLAAVNWIYYMRAKTEEEHLREDAVYRQYEAWIRKRSLIARLLPFRAG